MGEPKERTYSTAGPVCPYCGFEFTPDEGWFYDDSLSELDCGDCEKTFDVSVYNSTSWTCKPRQ